MQVQPPRLFRAVFWLVFSSSPLLTACKGDPTGIAPSDVGASGSQTPTGSMPSASVVNVSIQDFAFAPAMVTVKVGTTVKWTNNGPSAHTVMNDAGSWASALLAPPSTTGMGTGMGMGMGYGMDGMGTGMDGMGTGSNPDMGMGGPGASFQFTFTQPGTFPYHCAIHLPSMYPSFVGVVRVTP